jgi:hypothetical protein
MSIRVRRKELSRIWRQHANKFVEEWGLPDHVAYEPPSKPSGQHTLSLDTNTSFRYRGWLYYRKYINVAEFRFLWGWASGERKADDVGFLSRHDLPSRHGSFVPHDVPRWARSYPSRQGVDLIMRVAAATAGGLPASL